MNDPLDVHLDRVVVYRVGWGRYRVDEVYAGDLDPVYEHPVWGRRRAIRLAYRLATPDPQRVKAEIVTEIRPGGSHEHHRPA